MAERWRYAERNHPAYCTCVNCKGDGPSHRQNQSPKQLQEILEKWRSENFDPHYVLGISPNSSRKLIVEAHRRLIAAYHPDRHNNDPVATELTKRINAARDELLGAGRRGSRSKRERQRKQDEAQRARDAEQRRQREETQQRTRNAERQRQREEAQQRVRDAARRRQEEQRQREREDEELAREAARRQRTANSRYQAYQAQLRTKRIQELAWALLAVTFSTLIVAYLILTITAPDDIDSLMEEWAAYFN